jgi:acetate kinase
MMSPVSGLVRNDYDKHMIILTLNSGSTSIKLAAYDCDTRGGREPARLAVEHHSGSQIEPRAVLRGFISKLRSAPDVIAHRVVHGGARFTGPTRIDDSTEAEIKQLSELAPLHNPKAVEWIDAARAECGKAVVHVAVFDTSFFAGLPRVASEYALPSHIGVDQGVRRYGFHGLAHEAMWRRWCELYPGLPGGGRLISVQLGGGCSATALNQGRPLDNTMGFSPLEGLVMATRSGDVDPSILPYLQHRLSLTAEQVIGMLNHESGLLGLAGKTDNPS